MTGDGDRRTGANSPGTARNIRRTGPRRATTPVGPPETVFVASSHETGPEAAADAMPGSVPDASAEAQGTSAAETNVTPPAAPALGPDHGTTETRETEAVLRAHVAEGPESGPSQGGGGAPAHTLARVVRRLLLLLVVAVVVVVGLGTVVSSVNESQPAAPSATELARQNAVSSATVLAASAATLQTTAASPAVALQLEAAGTMLHGYLAALSLPGSDTPRTGTASASGSASPATGPAGIDVLISGLVANSTASLTAARTADGAMARVLASGGAAALMHARTLAAATGLPVPDSPYLLSPGTAAGTGGGTGGGTNVASGAPSGATSGGSESSGAAAASSAPCTDQRSPAPGINGEQALLTAVTAEQKAVYAYQVAATRLTNPASRVAVGILSAHEDSLSALQDLLAARCLPIPAVEPGYALAPGFTAQPAAALAGLEDQLGLVYGDLIALSGPAEAHSAADIRSQAITALLETTQHRWLWGAPDRPLPGLDLPADDGGAGTGATGSATSSTTTAG